MNEQVERRCLRQWFPTGGRVVLPPRGDLVISGDTVGCRIWEKGLLLASSDYRPGMLLNILRCTRQPSITKNDLTPNSTAKVEKPWSKAT